MSDEMERDELLLMLSEEGIVTNFIIDDEGHMAGLEINWELFKDTRPEMFEIFWEEHMAEVDETLKSLEEQGLLEWVVRVDEDGNIEEGYQVTQLGAVLGDAFKGVDGENG